MPDAFDGPSKVDRFLRPDGTRRPNHFYNDSLGDPETCTADCVHPVDIGE